MNNRKVAFICPTHPPHFNFAKSLISSFIENGYENQADLWFVFTNSHEADSFGDYEFKLILTEDICVIKSSGIINIKKLWALQTLRFSYEYIISIDSESLFIRYVDLQELCSDFFKAKILIGNKIFPEGKELTEKIKAKCKEFFSYDNKNRLGSDLYLWFNQPCIYKTSNLDKFFEITKIYEKLQFIDWFQFDYYIYMYFLILYENFSILDIEIESSYGVCESSEELLNIKSNRYKKLKIMICACQNLYLFDNRFLFLVIQVDRISSNYLININKEIISLYRKLNLLDEKILSLNKENDILKKNIKRLERTLMHNQQILYDQIIFLKERVDYIQKPFNNLRKLILFLNPINKFKKLAKK
ncbi:hypothetical protein [Snodgrassella gandavensis]|uniref:hypothetical protein n=1 Tax=Snodgrassella gandavensis TaxID=2946698 RepID=UPI001EF5A699|nr:hypothetical protein [Snodgrassella gandavensis]